MTQERDPEAEFQNGDGGKLGFREVLDEEPTAASNESEDDASNVFDVRKGPLELCLEPD